MSTLPLGLPRITRTSFVQQQLSLRATSLRTRSRWGQQLVRRRTDLRLAHSDASATASAEVNGSTTAHVLSKPKSTHPLRNAIALTTLTISATLSFVLGALYPPDLALLLSPRPSPPPPDPTSPESISVITTLESQLLSLPFIARLRTSPDAEEWYETRPYQHYPEERRVNSLTAGALRGAGRLGVSPLVRAKKDESESWVVVHVGRGVCGHDGIVHGGLLATLLDECMGRTVSRFLLLR